nr:MAG TPA: hypothetical protein [Caudoviricetes sp.]
MTVHKMIKFYVLEPEPCWSVNGLNSDNLNLATYTIFKSAFPQIDFYDMEFEKKKLFFDIKEYDDKKMFGTCSTDETIRATSFVQKRNKLTKEAVPYTTVESGEQLEAYTFFYIDFVHNRMAVIANKKISKIHEALRQFIWEKSGNMSEIHIFPEMIEDIRQEASSILNPSWIEMEFAKPNCMDDIPTVKESLGSDFQARKFKIKIKLEEKHNPNLIERMIAIKNNSTREDIPLLKLYGKNELGVDETLNFIESVYTKTVPLELTDSTVTNIEYIKKELERFLGYHLGKIAKH